MAVMQMSRKDVKGTWILFVFKTWSMYVYAASILSAFNRMVHFESTQPRGGQDSCNTCQARFPSKALQLNSDRVYEIAFLTKSLHQKTLYNIVAKRFSIQAMVFDLYAIVIVAIFQSVRVPTFLFTPSQDGKPLASH